MRTFGWVAVALVAVNLLLLLTGTRLLIGERIVQPGQHVVVGQWGDLASNQQASIVCRYWTGRSVTPIVWWYGNGFMSRDSCPFLHSVTS